MDRASYSPKLLSKIVFAGSTNSSFAQGSQDLLTLAEVAVSTKQVERICKKIGGERTTQRDEAVAAFAALPLTQRKSTPAGVSAPEVAVVGCDGGRVQIFDRAGGAVEAEAAEKEEGRSGQHWREDKIGLLMTMQSEESASDPCPEIPKHFLDPTRIAKLARELKTKASAQVEAASESATPELAEEALASDGPTWKPPEVKERRLTASRVRWPNFGPLLAEAAWSWGFFGASRRAFVGDGSENNWTIWRQHFSSFDPVLDFIHALSYVFASAMAGRRFEEGWTIYRQWIGWVWKGEVSKVIEALRVRQEELGEVLPEDGETHPRRVVARSWTYLQNHASKMQYAEYRRRGLPITSSYVESAVKQFNQRVKGTEKFWTEEGAEAMLQLRADHLSDHAPLKTFWQTREDTQTGQRICYMAA